MRILTIDIETLPHLVWAWGLHDQNISLNQIDEAGTIACFAAKWHGEKAVEFASVHEGTERAMLRKAHDLLSEADAVVGWNSASFDIKWLQGQFVKHKLPPPRPFKQIDLLRTARSKFKAASNKLDYWARFLGIGAKEQTGGFDLWKACMAGDEKAWKTMRRYNIQDVRLTEQVYDRLRPWVTNHPNIGVIDGAHCCPKCSSEKLQYRGHYVTRHKRYPQLQCRSCFAWLYLVSGQLQAGVQKLREAA
ncbi:MAG TPA: ribonuclease H-like domain-containing protein [Pseudoxanthomonas sp.]|nr:ribonuclease H-like domain-containing protein [Pseudoxanthomonas sp.]